MKKSHRPVTIAFIIAGFLAISFIAIFIGICWWDWYWGLVLLYTLLPAVCVASCVIVIVAVVLADKRSKEERATQDKVIQLTDEQPQKQQFCPNCGAAHAIGQKFCSNCSYEFQDE